MKRKSIFSFLLIMFLVLVCTACNGSVTRDIRHAGFTIGSDFICDGFYPKNKNDTSYTKIKYFTGSNIITDTGKIYELSLGQKYSNNQNCKVAETSLTVKAIMDNAIIKATDNKYYYLLGQSDVPKYSEITTSNNSYALYNMLLKDDDVVKVATADTNSGTYYVLKTDGNIYAKVINSKDRNNLQLASTKIVYDKAAYDGSNIIDFNYAGNTLATFIRTEKKVFRMRATNGDECNKYADVNCEYTIQEDPIFEKYNDRIITFNGSTLITDYKKMFTVAN